MGFRIKSKGGFPGATRYFKKLKDQDFASLLDKYGRAGVEELKAATPKDTGKTSESWYYTVSIDKKSEKASVTWSNSNIADYVPIAVILQYGHATGGGGYVEGVDYINPALKEVFLDMAVEAWNEVRNA